MSEQVVIGQNILEQRQVIAKSVVSRYGNLEMERGSTYGLDGPRFEGFVGYDVAYLAYAVQTGKSSLMTHYLKWLHSMLVAHALPAEYIVPMHLGYLREALSEALAGQELSAALEMLAEAEKEKPASAPPPDSFLDPSSSCADLAQDYLAKLLAGDRRGATTTIRRASETGVSVQSIYLEVFEPVQREVGRLWQTGKISVAREHFSSATTQLAMSQMYDLIFDPDAERLGRQLVAACIGDELHEIGLRMVADLAEMSGWDTMFLGANTPVHTIIETLRESGGDTLALSCSMIVHVEHIRSAIEALRAAGFEKLPILVGGYPFNLAPELAEIIGADGTASDASSATEQATALRAS